MRKKPWMTGPTELLHHALEHLKRATPFDYRISLISIDNAVELTIKTYLGLPKRIRKSDGPSREKLQEAGGSFPDLLNLLEGYSSEQQKDIELGEIEWYHRLRNTLYHEGSGITVDPDKVDSYLQIAKILCQKLLSIPIEDEVLPPQSELSDRDQLDEVLPPQSELGDLFAAWGQLEIKTRLLYFKHFPKDENNFHNLINAVTQLVKAGIISRKISRTIDSVCQIRNVAVYGSPTPDDKILKKTTQRVLAVVKEIGDL
jgi:uncharacterized protein YutE (UPF0331/DUF86 family)